MPSDVVERIRNFASSREKGSEQEEVKTDRKLAKMDLPKLGKHAVQLWKDWEVHYRRSNLEAKINLARWRGIKYVQRSPNDRNRIWLPPNIDSWGSKSFNEIERAVDRYVTQVFADDPIMEGVPRSQEDEDLDASDAATDAVQAEWARMKLNEEAFEAFLDACIWRSSFTHLFWDPRAGGKKAAQKFVTDPETGRETLEYVDGEGNQVDKDKAAKVWQGNLRSENLQPFQVRYSPDAKWCHLAAEVTVARMVTLRKAYEMYPDLEEVEIGKLLENRHVDLGGYLADFQADQPRPASDVLKDADTHMRGSEMSAKDRKRLLDQPVFFLVYYRTADRRYPDGYWCHVFGEGVVPEKGRGTLKKWKGRIPVVQMKCMYDPVAREGRALVDVLRSKQDVLDFMETQVLKYLKSLKARWAVSSTSVVNREALRNADHNEIVYYDGERPSGLEPPQMPHEAGVWHEKFKVGFDDAVGLHGSSKGMHVPGVQSGAHVEALQAADQSILSMSRRPIKVYLEETAKLVLAGIKGHWSEERQVAFLGRDERYVQRAFSRVDFGDTEDVILAPGSFLMVTPAQRAQIMTQLIDAQVFDQLDLKRLFPSKNVGGFALKEDPFYQRARRENDDFLAGPPPALVDAFEDMQRTITEIQEQMNDVLQNATLSTALGQPIDPEQQLSMFDRLLEQTQAEFQSELSRYMPTLASYEQDTEVSMIHAEEHFRALSRSRAERLRRQHPWWVEAFEAHAIEHATIGQRPGFAPQPQPQEQGQPAADPQAQAEAEAAAMAGAA